MGVGAKAVTEMKKKINLKDIEIKNMYKINSDQN